MITPVIFMMMSLLIIKLLIENSLQREHINNIEEKLTEYERAHTDDQVMISTMDQEIEKYKRLYEFFRDKWRGSSK